MKEQLFLILLIFSSAQITAQIQNSNFEEWDLFNGREKPKNWYCPNLCPSVTCGPCDKIEQVENDYSVRVHNVMPCVSLDNEANSRSAGYIEHHFVQNSEIFDISFDLVVDSIDLPANFIFTISGISPSGSSDSILVWKTSEIQSKRISHKIMLTENYDSLFIQFKSEGYLKSDSQNECDLGYLSAIVDNVETTEIVNIENDFIEDLVVYPNPFSDKIFINPEFKESTKYQIYNLKGIIMIEGEGIQIVDLDHLEKGIYILKIFVKNAPQFVKIFKE